MNIYKRYQFFDTPELAPKSVQTGDNPGLKRVLNSSINRLFKMALTSIFA